MLIQKKNLIIAGLAVIIIIESIFLFSFWLKIKILQIPKLELFPEVEVKSLEGGDIGEIKIKEEKIGKEIPLVSPDMPEIIHSTTGIIKEIKRDRLIVEGTGTNFADKKPRELNIIFTPETIIFSKNQALSWKGKAGINQLKTGMKILIGSFENIRGKVEFNAKTINIL